MRSTNNKIEFFQFMVIVKIGQYKQHDEMLVVANINHHIWGFPPMGQPHIWKKDRDTGQMAKRPNGRNMEDRWPNFSDL
jgi:hypothetical protein